MPTDLASTHGSTVEVEVTFNPPKEIIAKPEHAKVNWGEGQTARWVLKSTDDGAELHDIAFEGSDPKGPLPEMKKHADDSKVWNGGPCKKVAGDFKYDIVVKDGNGKEIRLDPVLGMGNPPP